MAHDESSSSSFEIKGLRLGLSCEEFDAQFPSPATRICDNGVMRKYVLGNWSGEICDLMPEKLQTIALQKVVGADLVFIDRVLEAISIYFEWRDPKVNADIGDIGIALMDKFPGGVKQDPNGPEWSWKYGDKSMHLSKDGSYIPFLEIASKKYRDFANNEATNKHAQAQSEYFKRLELENAAKLLDL